MQKNKKKLSKLGRKSYLRKGKLNLPKLRNFFDNTSTVPELRSRYSKSWPHTKLRYTNRTAPAPVQRPFLLAGELASPAAEF